MSHSRPRRSHAVLMAIATVPLMALVAACSDDGISNTLIPESLSCDLDTRFLADGGVGRDGIPAISNPTFVAASPVTASNRYVDEDDRVIAAWVDGEWLVIPHAIMYRHEIVNLESIVVTYCPLTGTALGFSRASVGGAELGVSGLLYQANLILYDRNSPDESLWPQMFAEARCGPRAGQALERVPLVEARYGEWLAAHPNSRVLAVVPGLFSEASYLTNPYGDSYETPQNGDFLGFPLPEADTRRLPKDRVLGIPDSGGGQSLAFDFRTMRADGERGAYPFEYRGSAAVVMWDDESEAAAAYWARVQGKTATFTVTPSGLVDDQTATSWSIGGVPLAGPLAGSGERLEPIAEAYVSFWRPWAAFHPGTQLALEN